MADKNEWIASRTPNNYKPKWYWELVYQFKQRRESLNISQLELDQIMGNADGLVGKWECGIRSPGAFNLTSWAIALQCEIKLENTNENLQA
ncbi:putative transcriptional regulator [uncultured Mediterranean phage uvMED]|nr:putative transcriptional regulator [uncultured Mediterranean phage uvMED]BAR16554.1 putative phage repressor [uncultured Mediterranean phage uvMED]